MSLEPLNGALRSSRRFGRVVMGWAIALASLIGVSFALTGFPFSTGYEHLLQAGRLSDVVHERATAWEAWHGDPYRSVDSILAEHGIEGGPVGVAPKTPATYLAHSAFLLVPKSHLLLFAVSAVIALTLVVMRLTCRVSKLSWDTMMLLSPVIAISLPFVTAMTHGSVTVVAGAALVLGAWAFPDRKWVGVGLGLAVAIRLWPALIVVGFWVSGRRRLAYEAFAGSVLFTGLGLLIPNVSVEGTVNALMAGSSHGVEHDQNSSLTMLLERFGVPIAASACLLVVGITALAYRRKRSAVDVTVVGGLLVVPLSWPAYVLTAMPSVIRTWSPAEKLAMVCILAPHLLWAVFPGLVRSWLLALSLIGILVMVVRRPIVPEPDRLSSGIDTDSSVDR